MAGAVAAVVAVALAAATIPVFRASRIDPAAALRAE
jgi:ABC-type antimicrobial peptide transport system permease subunit